MYNTAGRLAEYVNIDPFDYIGSQYCPHSRSISLTMYKSLEPIVRFNVPARDIADVCDIHSIIPRMDEYKMQLVGGV